MNHDTKHQRSTPISSTPRDRGVQGESASAKLGNNVASTSSGMPQARSRGESPTTDGQTPRHFLEPLARIFERDAHLTSDTEGSGTLLATSAEIVEFGLVDMTRALDLHRRASQHMDADPRAFAGIRRHARGNHDIETLRASYVEQFERARCVEDKMLAACGLTMLRMRRGEDSHSVLEFLETNSSLTEACSRETRALYGSLLEDALLRNGRASDAVAERVRRFTEFNEGARQPAADVADGALAVASLHESLGVAPDASLTWYETAFDAQPSAEALRPLLRRVYREEAWDVAESLLSDMIERGEDDDLRTSCRYQLGMLRAFRRGDRAGALQSLGEAMKSGRAAPLAATAFLAIARTSHNSVLPDEFVDALSARLDFAASPVERADLLTQMALRFDQQLEMPEAAIEMAREALDCCPTWIPAMRCLSDVYARDGHWDQFVELQLMLLEQQTDPEDQARIHARLAAAYQDELLEHEQAERHLLAALSHGTDAAVARRLAQLYSTQFRWEELHRHLMNSAENAETVREKTYFTEEAAEVAEHRLRNSDLAIDSYLALLELDTSNATAMSSLDRLYRQTERWEDLLRLNEHELGLLADEVGAKSARLSLLCRCAHLAIGKCSDMQRAEQYLAEALDLDATYGEALRAMGTLLKRQGRWVELIEMTETQLKSVTTDTAKARCLRHLGEIYATHTSEPKKAISWFRALADLNEEHAEEARIWLERLYEAAGMPEARLDILRERQQAAKEPTARARLAYRIAELLDWELKRPTEAFSEYMNTFSDELCVEESLRALTRLWDSNGVTRREHLVAIRTVQDAASRMSERHRRSALTFVAEQGHGILDDDATRAVWSTVAREWPDDLKGGEFLAALALRDGDVELAEEVRARRPAGQVEAARARWAHMDRCLNAPVWEHQYAVPRQLAGMLSREQGGCEDFDSADDRQRFASIRRGEIVLDALRGDQRTESASRLSIMAAREMGENVALRNEWQNLIRTFSDNRRSLRAWLDLCEEDSASSPERSQWLREAEQLGCFDHPMREALYTAFQSNGDIEGFADAVERHLRSSNVEGEKAARLALRKGHALDHLGRREQALESMRFANIHAPAMTEAAIEKARLETLLDKVGDARQTLEDVLDAGASGRERLEVLGRLADLHLMDGGEHTRAIRALEDAWELSGRNRDWTVRLATAHATYGDAARAVSLLEDVLGDEPVESELRQWHLLIRLQEGALGQPEAAEETLWKVFKAFPAKTKNLEALYNHYRKRSGAPRFAARLRDLLIDDELELDDEKKAALWCYVGELFYSVLHALPEAEYAYEAASRIDGGLARTSLKLARCISGQGRREREAIQLARKALMAGDATIETWKQVGEVIETTYAQLEDGARHQVAKQLLKLSGVDSSPVEKPSKMPAVQLTEDRVWELVGHGLMDSRDRYVLQASAALAEKVLLSRSQRRVRGGEKLDTEATEFFMESLDRTCWSLDTETPQVQHADSARGIVAAENAYLLDASRVSEDSPLAAQFWSGVAAGVAFSEMGPYLMVEDADILELLRSVAVKSMNYEFPEHALYVDDVSGFFTGPQRRPVVMALKDVPEFFETTRGGWKDSLVSFCDRMGLVACGNLDVAASEILRATADTDVDAAHSPRIQRLADYALSDAFYVARYELGMGRRPVLMDTNQESLRARKVS